MQQSWRQFTRDWRLTAGISLWFLLPIGLDFLRSIFQTAIPMFSNGNTGLVSSFLFLSAIIALPAAVINFIVYFLTPVRLYRLMLKRDTQHPDATSSKSSWPWDLLGPFLWIVVLFILMLLGCLLAGVMTGGITAVLAHVAFHAGRTWTAILSLGLGSLTTVLCSVYFGVLFSQSIFLLIEDDVHGTGAFKRSAQLVHGRWWSVFGRLFLNQLIMGLLFLSVFAIVFALSVFLIWTISGFQFSNLNQIFGQFASNPAPSSALVSIIFIFGLIITLVPVAFQICVSPYFMTYTVKLFHALKASR